MLDIIIAITSCGFGGKKKKKRKNIMFQNKKLQAETGATEVLKVAIFIIYVEHSLNSIISPSKVPAIKYKLKKKIVK